MLYISSFALENSFFSIDTHITFLDVPHALPNAFFDGTKT
jgi:hypothetical protein